MRLLIVDDSVVFRSQIKSAVESVLPASIISTAANGKIALQKLEQESFDVMTLDMEMPEMNGMETLREIKARKIPVRVVVFAAQTSRAASGALEALKLGAMEIVTKPDGSASSFDEALTHVKDQLLPILKNVEEKVSCAHANSGTEPLLKSILASKNTVEISPPNIPMGKIIVETFRPKIILIGCSTGGPNALESIFSTVKPPTNVPILIVQHMPPTFTASLAQRIAAITGVEASEGLNGEKIKPGRIYVAPGNYHMGLFGGPNGVSIRLTQSPKRCNVRPAVDVLFEDAASIYEKNVGAMVLTGMGEDGLEGCKAIKSTGGCVVIQDKETSVVWGMPGAIHAAGLFDKMGSLQDCGRVLRNWSKTGL